MTLSRKLASLAKDIIDAELDAGRLTYYTDDQLTTATRLLAEELQEAANNVLYDLHQAEPTSCDSRRCGTCDMCADKGDQDYHERREAA